jgi:CHAD domain-containing protein
VKPCDPDVTFKRFGLATTEDLLHAAAEAVNRAVESPDPEAVHKMRVAIRRFQQGLRLFRQFLRKRAVQQVRRELKRIMEPAGQLRNFDIAIGLVRRAKADTADLKERRLHARNALVEALREIAQADLAVRWRNTLEFGVE